MSYEADSKSSVWDRCIVAMSCGWDGKSSVFIWIYLSYFLTTLVWIFIIESYNNRVIFQPIIHEKWTTEVTKILCNEGSRPSGHVTTLGTASDDGFSPIRRQAIIWTGGELYFFCYFMFPVLQNHEASVTWWMKITSHLHLDGVAIAEMR